MLSLKWHNFSPVIAFTAYEYMVQAKNYTCNNNASFVSYNVVMEVTMNYTIFYDVTPCSLVGTYTTLDEYTASSSKTGLP